MVLVVTDPGKLYGLYGSGPATLVYGTVPCFTGSGSSTLIKATRLWLLYSIFVSGNAFDGVYSLSSLYLVPQWDWRMGKPWAGLRKNNNWGCTGTCLEGAVWSGEAQCCRGYLSFLPALQWLALARASLYQVRSIKRTLSSAHSQIKFTCTIPTEL